MRLLRYQDLPVTRWKNGAGVTREIASLQEDGAGSDFLWRVSIATISASGPFSRFDNVDRTIAVLGGNGIRLGLPAETVDLTTSSQPYAFAGETPISATVIDGETTDLNAMSLRKRFRQTMQMHLVTGAASIRATAQHSILVFGGPMTIASESERHSVAACDALANIGPGTALTITAPEPTRLYLIGFQPVG